MSNPMEAGKPITVTQLEEVPDDEFGLQVGTAVNGATGETVISVRFGQYVVFITPEAATRLAGMLHTEVGWAATHQANPKAVD